MLDLMSGRTSRSVFALGALVLVPGLALALAGLRGFAEREATLRTQYLAATTLVRDRLAAELARRAQTIRDRFADRLDDSDPRIVRDRLVALEADSSWLAKPFFVRGTSVAGPLVHTSWHDGHADPLTRHPRAAGLVAEAEAAEFRQDDLDRALRTYREAADIVPARSAAAAFLLTRVGRTLFKLRRVDDGLRVYRDVLAVAGDEIDRNGIPYAVISSSQVIEGLGALGRLSDRAAADADQLRYLIEHPWDLADGYGRRLELALAAPGTGDERLVARGRAMAAAARDVEWLRRDVVPRLQTESRDRPEETIPRFAAVTRDGQPTLIAFCSLGSNDDGRARTVGYAVQVDGITALLATVVRSVDIAPGVTVAATAPEVVRGDQATPVAEPLARVPLFPTTSGWMVSMSDARGRSIGAIVARERSTYSALVSGMLVVMVVGVVLIARASARAAELSRLKSAFVANVSHELKTPLALIRMYGETLESGIVSEEDKRREFSGIIRRESERLTHLIDNVLDLGRIEAGSKRYTVAQADLAATVRDALDAYRPLFERLGFHIDVTLPDRPIELLMDRGAIIQALVNLLQNVIKYAGDGGYVAITVQATDEWARVSVADHGIGIASADLARVFEPYYRSASAGVRSSGSGLGLSIVKHALDAHGGRVEVVSTPGTGSVFTIVLPRSAHGCVRGSSAEAAAGAGI